MKYTERIKILTEEAAALRQAAERCTKYPELRRRIAVLADSCDALADNAAPVIEKSGKPQGPTWH